MEGPLRIIFLDIDGVICCNSMGRLEDKKLRILQGAAQAAGAKIVLSTDWWRCQSWRLRATATALRVRPAWPTGKARLRGSFGGCSALEAGRAPSASRVGRGRGSMPLFHRPRGRLG